MDLDYFELSYYNTLCMVRVVKIIIAIASYGFGLPLNSDEDYSGGVGAVVRSLPPNPNSEQRAGNWVGITNAKALGIVWRNKTSKTAKQKCRIQEHANCTAAGHLLALARILSLQTIPSAIAVLIRT